MARAEKDTVTINNLEDYGSISRSQDLLNAINLKRRPLDQRLYFNDGARKIDYVLVWEEDIEHKDKAKPKTQEKIRTEERQAKRRAKFQHNLRKVGVEMEDETSESEKKVIHYVKLSIPWDVMCYFAEDLCLRAPLQVQSRTDDDWSNKVLKTLHIRNIMHQEVPYRPNDYFTCAFKKSKLDRFMGSDNHSTYFTATQRHQVAYEILATQVYGRRSKAEIGIDRMVESEAYTAAFPLHEGTYLTAKDYKPDELNPRQVLRRYWGRWGMWYKYQPLDNIREYFGEKIGLYFAWLGLYTAWLLPASVIGLIIFACGIATITLNVPGQEVCKSNTTFVMCPLCDETIGCRYWYLSDVCLYTKIAYLFDNPGTVVFAVFVAFWAVTFLEYWKRKNADLAYHWDVMNYQEEEERPRPEYAALCPTQEANPITGIVEPHFPQRQRYPRILTGIACIIVMMTLVFIFIIAVIIYRVLITIPLYQNDLLRSQAPTIASMSAAVVNLILIMALGKVYEIIAFKLTQWEMHRTQSEFENQLIFKVFVFQFVNFYSSIFYIAFFKGKFVGYPGHYIHFFGLRNEECNNGGCLIELAQQLAVIMIGKQVINNVQEVLIPKLKAWFHRFKSGLSGKKKDDVAPKPWEEDYELIPYEGLLEEYLEMVLQFGFITIFVAAFPLAPLFALLNNWIEIRLDAHKLVVETRRPVAERAQDIGIWFTILDALTQLAVISNAFLIAFTSEFLPQLLYKFKFNPQLKGYVNYTLAWAPQGTTRRVCRYQGYRDNEGNFTMFFWTLLCVRLAFVIIFEHVVFFVSRMLDLLIPDVPDSLEIKIKREQFLAKQALHDSELVVNIEAAANAAADV